VADAERHGRRSRLNPSRLKQRRLNFRAGQADKAGPALLKYVINCGGLQRKNGQVNLL